MNEEVLARVPKDMKGFYNCPQFLTRNFIETIAQHVDLTDVRRFADIGSRDLCQTLELGCWFPAAKTMTFEPNPEGWELCVQRHNESVNNGGPGCNGIYGYALTNEDGPVVFQPIDMSRSPSKNVGASSLFKVSKNFTRERWVQKKIEVPGFRMDTILSWGFDEDDDWQKGDPLMPVDIVWMDVQGAELLVLEGFGKELEKVKAIHTEVAVKEVYEGACLKPELDQFMRENGFKQVASHRNHEWEMDVIYVNERFIV